MTEKNIKNRAWVKNAAIIFLAVMLVLTFFSNTIMNHSLPEVAAQYAQAGTITAQIRGSGIIEAAETYEVKSEDARTVKSVAVRVGQEVEVGDLLVTLAEGNSAELDAAYDALEDLQYSYQEKLINLGMANGEKPENEALLRAQEKLEDAVNASSMVPKVTNDELNLAKIALDLAQEDLEAAGATDSYGTVSALTEAETAMEAAKAANMQFCMRNDTRGDYTAQEAYDALEAVAEYCREYEKNGSYGSLYSLEAYMDALAKEWSKLPEDDSLPIAGTIGDGSGKDETPGTSSSSDEGYYVGNWKYKNDIHSPKCLALDVKVGAGTSVYYSKRQMSDAYMSINEANKNYEALLAEYENYEALPSAGESSDVVHYIRARNKAKAEYEKLVKQKGEYDAARDNVLSCQEAVEDIVKTGALDDLSLQRIRGDMGKQYKIINQLKTGGAGGDITSQVAGVVKSINVTAGNTADPSTPILTIEVPDRGYTVSIGVTKEQAQRVSVGTVGTVSMGYWGAPDISARLARIASDPADPRNGKKLIFDISGEDIESGSQVTVSVGEKSRNFDVIVPNSAIREDSNGKFVLLITVKSSPLGNRYIATRTDVQVLASDDMNSAISGGISSWGDYVVTTSSVPIESGMAVRMAES